MAPRQRLSTPPSLDEVTTSDSRPLLGSSASEDTAQPPVEPPNGNNASAHAATVVATWKTNANGKTASHISPAVLAADIAREEHDCFNLVALVSRDKDN